MDCQHITDGELVEKYLSGQLDPAVQDDLEVHLLSCPHCLARAETLKTIRAGLASAQEIPEIPTRSAWVRWGAVAAALILCALAIYQLRHSIGKPNQTANTPAQPSPSPPVVPKPQNDTGGHPSGQQPRNAEKKNLPPTTKPAGDERQAQKPTPPPNVQVASDQKDLRTQGAGSQSATPRKKPSPGMSEEDAVELYRLAAVQAPPYNFGAGPSASPAPESDPRKISPTQSFSLTGGPARALFQQAMLAYVESRYEDAARLLEKLLQDQPRVIEANFYLGICRLMQGHPSESVTPLKEVLAAPASSLTQSTHFYLAKAYLQMSDLEQAEREMQAAAALPGNLTTEAQSLAGRIHALRGAVGTQEK